MSRKTPNPPPSTKQRKPPAPPNPPQPSLVSISDIFGNAMPTENYAVKILTEIRDALGVGSQPMLSDLPEIIRRTRQGSERYNKVRKLYPAEFTNLWRKSFYGEDFDCLVDSLN